MDQNGSSSSSDCLFQSRVGSSQHISIRQYNRISHEWINTLILDETLYSTHSMRGTKPYLINKKRSIFELSSYC